MIYLSPKIDQPLASNFHERDLVSWPFVSLSSFPLLKGAWKGLGLPNFDHEIANAYNSYILLPFNLLLLLFHSFSSPFPPLPLASQASIHSLQLASLSVDICIFMSLIKREMLPDRESELAASQGRHIHSPFLNFQASRPSPSSSSLPSSFSTIIIIIFISLIFIII